MKTLFLLDGVYGDAKKALCEIFYEHDAQDTKWQLIQKGSTKPKEKLLLDMYHIEKTEAESYFSQYRDKTLSEAERENLRFFCYMYPKIMGYEDEDVINCIDNKRIEDLTRNNGVDYGFLVVRNRLCINDLVSRYEKNGPVNVVPVFVYTDYSYLSGEEKLSVLKWERLFENYIDTNNALAINYENILIFRGANYNDAKTAFETQIINLIKRVQNKNNDLFVVTEQERTYLPEHVKGANDKFKKILIKEITTPQIYRKNIFVMMKFHGTASNDEIYSSIKKGLSKAGYNSIRADDDYISKTFGHANPDQRYWLATFLCKFGIALFEMDEDNYIKLNPNVIYEMGIMKQQGKKIFILVPKGINKNDENAKLFFDVNNEWRYEYENKEDIEEQMQEILKEVKNT